MATEHNQDVDENYVIATPSRKSKDKKRARFPFGKKGQDEAAAASEPAVGAAGEADDAAAGEADDAAACEAGTVGAVGAAGEAPLPGKSDGACDESAEGGESGKKKRRGPIARLKTVDRQKLIVAIVVIVVVIGAAGVGFWKWHETPEFCGAICHSPMDPYMPTYYSEPGEQGVDKWGNTVEDSSAMLAPTHRAYADMACMGCHVPAMQEQITEGIEWVMGNYYYPLNERKLSRLVYYRGVPENEFCLNSACHNMTKNDLTDATSESVRNPHSWHHNEYTCSDCHKAHRASVMICSQCHQDYTLPDGWLTYQEAQDLETRYGYYDDFE